MESEIAFGLDLPLKNESERNPNGIRNRIWLRPSLKKLLRTESEIVFGLDLPSKNESEENPRSHLA